MESKSIRIQQILTSIIYTPLVRILAFPYIEAQQLRLDYLYRKSEYGRKIQQYNKIHLNNRCFIIANGPSLTVEDLNILYENNEICFGMNDIFELFDNTQWRPNYYFVYDRNYMRLKYDQVLKLPLKHMFFAYRKVPSGKYVNRPNIEYFNTEYVFSIKPEGAISDHVFDALDKKVSFSPSTTQVCIEFAIYMGFKEIFLLGVDHNYSYGEGKNHAKGMKDHEYFGKKVVFGEESSTKKFELFEKYSKKIGVKIYNATRGGKLEVYERCDFDKIWD